MALTLAGGCKKTVGEQDEEERKRPAIAEAQAQKDRGAINEAVRLYREAVETDPNAARAHLDLAILLHERRRRDEDYIEAIYHYWQYLKLRPDTQKDDLIKDRIQNAKLNFAASIKPEQRNNAAVTLDDPRQKEELARREKAIKSLQKKVSELQSAVASHEKNEDALQRDNRKLKAANADLQKQLVALRRGQRPTLRAYTVKRGDSLRAIAQDIYGDAEMANEIYRENSSKIADPNNLQVGQVLRLP